MDNGALLFGQDAGLIDSIEGLERYHLLHSARADMLRRLGRDAEAGEAYGRALEHARNPAERAFLRSRIEATARQEPGNP